MAIALSLHAGVATEATQRDKLDRLCRYVSRPAVSEKRLVITAHEQARYELKTPYPNSTIHILFEPLEFIAKPSALVRKPRVNLTPASTVSLCRIASTARPAWQAADEV